MAYMRDSTGRRLDSFVVSEAVSSAVNLSGGNTTVTLAQVRSRRLELTAATATVIVTFPNASFACRVTNSTDFAQTIKRSGATNTITLESGGSMELVA